MTIFFIPGVPEIKTPLTKKDLVGSRTSREEILTLIQETKKGGATSSSVQSLDSYYDDLSSEVGGWMIYAVLSVELFI